ncbi:MAG: hypothetical protein ACXAAH_05055 [Promethearchaeota archaeon]|jgi:predicted ATP-dependent serine protease
MKSIYSKFSCPQCGEVRFINVNGICFDCRNDNKLEDLIRKRKKQDKDKQSFTFLEIESYF